MALIKCSECGKEFSDKAKACPNCACPVEYSINSKETEQIEQEIEQEVDNNKIEQEVDNNKIEQEVDNKQTNVEIKEVNHKKTNNKKANNSNLIQGGFFNGLTKKQVEKVKKLFRYLCIPYAVVCIIIFLILKLNVLLSIILGCLCGGVGAFISCLYKMIIFWFKNHCGVHSFDSKKMLQYIGIFLIMCVIAGFISSCDNGSSNGPSDSEMNACRARSNTYTKCSWSVLENRCVCKFR